MRALGSDVAVSVVACVQRHAVEQGHHPQGVCGLHPQAAAGAAAGQGAGEPAEEAGAHQPASHVEDTGETFTPEPSS